MKRRYIAWLSLALAIVAAPHSASAQTKVKFTLD